MSPRIDIFWHGGLAFCPACQSQLAGEEIDFKCCDACGGEGFDDERDDDEDFYDPRFEELTDATR